MEKWQSHEEEASSPCFCLHKSCGFSGSVESLIDHVKHVHNLPVHEFNYGMGYKIEISSSCEFTFLRAKEDGCLFVLWTRIMSDHRLLKIVRVGPPCLDDPGLKFQIKTRGYECIRDTPKNGKKRKLICKAQGSWTTGVVKNTTLENGYERMLDSLMLAFSSKLQHPISGDFSVRFRITELIGGCDIVSDLRKKARLGSS